MSEGHEKNGNGFAKSGQAVMVFITGCLLLWAGNSLDELKGIARENRIKIENLESKVLEIVPRAENERRYASMEKRQDLADERMTRTEQVMYSAIFGVGKKTENTSSLNEAKP